MTRESFTRNAHLYLGITRQELSRRLSLGMVDIEILKAQIEQNSRETKLETACELKIKLGSLEQVDKFEAGADSPL